jgi:EAL domain-containing protein (putative c-di-GMP-specific phosphodiesterase class I)/ActR/RegA family two-component response regulator
MERSYKRLLVIDDDPAMCDLVVQVAQDRGFETASATRQVEFKRLCHEFRPTFIVMDLTMPDSDGIELLRFLGSGNNKATIILVSGVEKKILSAAKQVGVDLGLNIGGALQKPVEISALEAMISVTPNLREEALIGEFTEALNNDQLTVFYQPKTILTVESHHPIKEVEALVRWQHPERGLLAPAAFLNIVERANLFSAMTIVVASQAFKQVAVWEKNGLTISVAVNFAPQLLTNLSLPDEIAQLAREFGVPAERVVIEITEAGVMDDPHLAMDILTRFRLKGFRLSLDDFGTGFSSLTHLYHMPFSELKIDQSFVRDICKNDEARIIVGTMIDMARNLNLSVCAEGVDSREVLDFLLTRGCEKAQGYFISKPVSAKELEAFVVEWNRQSNPVIKHA